MAENYDPSQEYAQAYNALQGRIRRNFAGQRANLNQELATRGVQTSGVSSIPSAALGASEAGAMNDAASNFALEQARTKVADRQAQDAFNRESAFRREQMDNQNALQRRLGQQQMWSQIGGAALGAAGSLIGGPPGAAAGSALGKYTTGKLIGNYGQGGDKWSKYENAGY